jgi:hypothetical protein
LSNARLLSAIEQSVLLWRQIIWPERKAWLLGVLGAVFGIFSNIVNLLLREAHWRWLPLGLGLGAILGLARCWYRMRQALKDLPDGAARDAKIDAQVQCAPCAVFRFFFFSCVTLVFLTTTSVGELSTEVIAQRLGLIDTKLDRISRGVADVDSKLKQVKTETSSDPRKELANLGVLWTVDAFFNAIRQGDDRTVKLFLAGRMTTETADSQGRPLPVVLALNNTNAGEILGLLVGAGLDVNHSYEIAGALAPQHMTLLSRAIEKGSTPLAAALIKHHADLDAPMQTFGVMGLTRNTFPLAAAVYWKRLEIARLLLDAGANTGVGDYAAYREARALREKSNLDAESSARLDALMKRLSPAGTNAARIENELRLQEVEQKLNQVALAGLRAMPGSVERRKLDAEYDELQSERTKLRQDLDLAAK